MISQKALDEGEEKAVNNILAMVGTGKPPTSAQWKIVERYKAKIAGESEPLLAKHELFCTEYVKGESATQAYINAGYDVSSRTTAESSASRLLLNAKVKSRIAELKASVCMDAIMTREELLEMLSIKARGSIGEVMQVDCSGDVQPRIGPDGTPLLNSSPLARRMKPTDSGLDVEIVDPMKAADLLARMQGYYHQDSSAGQGNLVISYSIAEPAQPKPEAE
jgi:phage terminase small subunit